MDAQAVPAPALTGGAAADPAQEQEPINFGFMEYALERLRGFYLRCADIDARYPSS